MAGMEDTVTNDCKRYEDLLAWVIGPAADPAASDEDRELSDEDILFIINHQGRCNDPEHRVPRWSVKLAEMDARVAHRFRTAFADLDRQERGELTPDSPHHWAIEALKDAGTMGLGLPDLIGRKYVFTYNEDANDGDDTTQCGVVTGTIVSASVGSYPQGANLVEMVTLTVKEAYTEMPYKGQRHLAKIVALQRASDDTLDDTASKQWCLTIIFHDPHDGLCLGLSGKLVILKPD